jgi:hypothetical protein
MVLLARPIALVVTRDDGWELRMTEVGEDVALVDGDPSED